MKVGWYRISHLGVWYRGQALSMPALLIAEGAYTGGAVVVR